MNDGRGRHVPAVCRPPARASTDDRDQAELFFNNLKHRHSFPHQGKEDELY